MKNIIQISDLHFGRIDEIIVGSLIGLINKLNPDVLVVSGDLTQRAKISEFSEAQKFLNNFDCPKIIVPGNHDIPLYNLWKRFIKPYKNFHKIESSLAPFYYDDEIAIIGINTSRSLVFKGGRLNNKQLGIIKQKISSLDEKIIKILVTHHPLKEISAKRKLQSLLEFRIDAFLCGHLHINEIKKISHPDFDHAAISIQSGTSTSSRYRGEPNNFNQIIIENKSITVQPYTWDNKQNKFIKMKNLLYERSPSGWSL